MLLHMIGMNTRHESTFGINRPEGSGDNLLIIFKTEADLYSGAKSTHVYPGCCIVYKKNFPQHYEATADSYVDHYIHFDACDESVFETMKFPTDSPFYLRNLEEVETILRLLCREQISESEYKIQNADLLFQLLFLKLSENACESPYIKNDNRHREELTLLRSEMYSTPGKYSSVKELSDAVNISLSHFQALYSSYFGVSCYEDLSNAKISAGKNFLASSDLPVKEIAFLCGFATDTCFMRSFKKKEGLTPSEYRKQCSLI